MVTVLLLSAGKLLMVNSGAKEQLFFEAPRGHRQALRNAKVSHAILFYAILFYAIL